MYDSKGCKDKLPEQILPVKLIGFHGNINKIMHKRSLSL